MVLWQSAGDDGSGWKLADDDDDDDDDEGRWHEVKAPPRATPEAGLWHQVQAPPR